MTGYGGRKGVYDNGWWHFVEFIGIWRREWLFFANLVKSLLIGSELARDEEVLTVTATSKGGG